MECHSSTDSDLRLPKNRNRSKKKQKLTRRQSYRLKKMMILSKIKSQAVDRSHLNTICVTRTVEWPATHTIGNEKSKLLFMLAIGLNPKPGATQNLPRVKLQKFQPNDKSKTKAKEKGHLVELKQKRKRAIADLSNRARQFLTSVLLRRTSPFYLKDSVEVVNIVSDEDDDGDQNYATEAAQPSIQDTLRHLKISNPLSLTCMDTDIKCSQKLNRSTLQNSTPLLLKKDDKTQFQKSTPESITKLVDGTNAKIHTSPSMKESHIKLMVSVNKANPASFPLTVRNQAPSRIRPTNGRIRDGVSNTQNSNSAYGVRNCGDSSITTPENLITIDID